MKVEDLEKLYLEFINPINALRSHSRVNVQSEKKSGSYTNMAARKSL